MHPGVVGRRGRGSRRALLFACALASVLPAWPIQAQETPELTLSLDAISPWIDDAHPLEISLRIRNLADAPRTDLRVEAWLLQPVHSRSQLAEVVDGDSAEVFSTATISDVTVRTSRVVRLRATRDELGSPGLGIYPLSIRVSDGDGLLTESRTAVPVINDPPSTRIRMLTVADIVDPDPPIRLQGGYDPATIDVSAMRAAADRIDALDGSRPLVHVDGATVEAIADLSDGALIRSADGRISDLDAGSGTATVAARLLRSLRRVALGGGTATTTYVPIDIGAMIASRATSRVGRQFSRADDVIRAQLDRLPVDALVRPELRDREAFPVDTAIVSPDQIESIAGAPFSPDLFGVSTPVGLDEMRVLVSDERLTTLSRGDPGWVASAQAIVAETALRWLELPLVADERLMVFAPDPSAPPRLLDHVADAFRRAPWLRRVLPAQAGDAAGTATIAASQEPVRTLSLAIPAAGRSLRAIRSVLPEDASEVAAARITEWETAILIAERTIDGSVGDPELADAIRTDIDAHLDRLKAATDRRITLTSRQGEIPIVLQNENDFTVQINVHLSGSRLSFPDGRDFPVRLDPGDTTLDVPVEVLGQGTFPLEVSITTPAGTVLSTTLVDLRSTRVSRVAAIVIGGAILFLFLQAARKRRKVRA